MIKLKWYYFALLFSLVGFLFQHDARAQSVICSAADCSDTYETSFTVRFKNQNSANSGAKRECDKQIEAITAACEERPCTASGTNDPCSPVDCGNNIVMNVSTAYSSASVAPPGTECPDPVSGQGSVCYVVTCAYDIKAGCMQSSGDAKCGDGLVCNDSGEECDAALMTDRNRQCKDKYSDNSRPICKDCKCEPVRKVDPTAYDGPETGGSGGSGIYNTNPN